MADYTAQINAFIQTAIQRVGGKSSVNSIDPIDVSGCDQDLATLLLPILNTINNFNILPTTPSTIAPTNGLGNDDDIYIQGGTSITFWKKISGTWVSKAVVPLGINVPNGNQSVQVSVNSYVVTASSGSWWINNIQYAKGVQTQFTVSTPHPTLDRIDAVFGNNVGTGNLVYQAGTPSNTPAEPMPPSGSVFISYIYVPSTASGQLPYIANTNSGGSGGGATKTVINGTEADIEAWGSFGRLPIITLTAVTPFIASFTKAGETTFLNQGMLVGGYVYGFPSPGDGSFTYTITYLI